MSLGTNLPFHDRTGMLEHSRDFSHLTLSERERIAFAAGDHATVALIHATEEECADIMSPEHEAMIDDRNRLRDALQTCTDRLDDAIGKLDTFNEHDDRLADGALIDDKLIEPLRDASAEAEDALERCDEQIDETLADKLRKVEAERDNLRGHAEADARMAQRWHDLRGAVRFVLKPYALHRPYDDIYSATAPKWAAHLIATLARLEKP
jgi:chromosome segregation ATPase